MSTARPSVKASKVAEITSLQARAMELLKMLFDRDCAIYAHEITIPMHSHADACRLLLAVRELLASAEGKV